MNKKIKIPEKEIRKEELLELIVGESLEIVIRRRVGEMAEKSLEEVKEFMESIAEKKDKASYIDMCVANRLGKAVDGDLNNI